MLHFSFLAVDPALSRLDFDSMSDQMRMEILVGNLPADQVSKYQDANGNFKDVCEWECITCDTEKNVTVVHFNNVGSESNMLNLSYIPPHVIKFTYALGGGSCVFRPEELPQAMVRIAVAAVKVLNQVDFTAFPPRVKQINLWGAQLHGTCDMQSLPADLEDMCIMQNSLTGSLLLDKLPTGLQDLQAQSNQFTGALVLDKLPAAMEKLNLSRNKFTSFRLATALQPLKKIDIDVNQNQISGTVTLAKATNGRKVRINFDANRIDAVVDEQGKKHRFAKTILPRQEDNMPIKPAWL